MEVPSNGLLVHHMSTTATQRPAQKSDARKEHCVAFDRFFRKRTTLRNRYDRRLRGGADQRRRRVKDRREDRSSSAVLSSREPLRVDLNLKLENRLRTVLCHGPFWCFCLPSSVSSAAQKAERSCNWMASISFSTDRYAGTARPPVNSTTSRGNKSRSFLSSASSP